MSAVIGFALAAMVMNGLTDYAFKEAAAGSMRGDYRTHHFIIAQSVLFFSLTTLYGWAAGELRAGPYVLVGMLAGVFMFTGFNCFAWSLQHGNVSVNAPIFRLNFLVTAALSMALLGEPPLAMKLAGLGLALAAVWLLIGAGAHGASRHAADIRKSLLLAMVSTLALGAGNTLHKIGLQMGGTPATQLASHSLVYLVLSVATVMRADGKLAVPRAVWPVAAMGAVMGAGGFVAMMKALQVGQASVVVPIAQMGLVVSAPLGIAVFGERLTGRKVAGLAAALGALGLLALS